MTVVVISTYQPNMFLLQEKSSGRSAHYKLTSTAMLWLQTNRVGSGTMNLGGSLTRQVEQVPALPVFQLPNGPALELGDSIFNGV